jgi:DNA repair exonuclease SbcCD nuclease subunit
VLHQGLLDISKFAGEMAANDLPRNFTYYAMGHYHDKSTHRFSHLGGPLVYPGSIEMTPSETIRETEKGFYIVDLSAKEPLTHWQRLDTRPQLSVPVRYDELAARLEELVRSIGSPAKKPVVHLKITGREIDPRQVANKLVVLANQVLHYTWDLLDEAEPYTIIEERPGDILAKLFELASKNLGDDRARFAVNELLPLLESEETAEALEIVWQDYERSKQAR